MLSSKISVVSLVGIVRSRTQATEFSLVLVYLNEKFPYFKPVQNTER
jgi:hypothetical protein